VILATCQNINLTQEHTTIFTFSKCYYILVNKLVLFSPSFSIDLLFSDLYFIDPLTLSTSADLVHQCTR